MSEIGEFMLQLNRRAVFLLLISMILLSLIVRYPMVEHERHQTDSYFVHMLSDSIVDSDYAQWAFSPLSLFGYYPFSYPSGVPFLLAETSDVTGLNLEASILLFNMILSVLFCLSVFILAREFSPRLEVILLATLFAILGARFVDTTYWDASARGPLVVFATLAVSILLRANSRRQSGLVFVSAIVLLACFSIHHMAVLVLLFGIAYVMSAYQTQYLLSRFDSNRHGFIAVSFNLLIVASVIGVGFGVWSYFGVLALRNLGSTSLFDFDPVALSVVANLAAVYTNQVGFVLIPAVIGAPYLLMKRPHDGTVLLLLAVMIVFIPVLGNSLYISMILTPFIAILGSKSLATMLFSGGVRLRRHAAISAVVLIVVASLLLTAWSTNKWTENEYATGDTVRVDSCRYNDANYLLYQYGTACAISNSNHAQLQFAALSGVNFLDSGVYQVLCGDVGPLQIEDGVTWSKADFPTNLYTWFDYSDEQNINLFVLEFMKWGIRVVDDGSPSVLVREYFSQHDRILVVVDNGLGSQYANPYFVQDPLLLEELKDAVWSLPGDDSTQCIGSYVSYSSSGSTVYLLGL